MRHLFGLWDTPEESRFNQARLKLVVATLPSTIMLNPLWALALFLPFLGTRFFGSIPLWHVALGFGLHSLTSSAAALIYWRNRHGTSDWLGLERQLVALQFAISVAWGIVLWLFSDAGHPVNNIYVCMVFTTVIWAVVFTRVSHAGVFLAGFMPLTLSYGVLLFTSPGEVSRVFSILMPLWTIYILVMGVRGRQTVDRALAAQFANDDLAAALRASNADAVRQAQEAQSANAAKTAFLANMSHELRTPLNAVLGFSDIIARQALGPDAMPRYSEYAADINTSGRHLLSLINDLLDIAKIEAGKMEIEPHPLDAAAVAADVQRLMAARVRARNQSVALEVEPDLPLVVADERAFRQILLNLFSNAVKFTPEGGEIVVRCRRAGSGGFALEVADNGPGIAPEKQERVFQPFTQIDNRYGRALGGTGLGLALVRGLAELHGGRAWIESALGQGTKVSVYFPLVTESQQSPALAFG
ncbi:MAG: ATP-binding protein [Rhizomicrobium sp.]